MSTLEVSELSVRIGGTPVVTDVSFDVGAGERVGLIGESGSGKSLTALAIMGLLGEGARADGSVTVSDERVLDMPERRLARLRGDRMAMVFQEPMTALDPVMQVGHQVAQVIRLHRRVSRREARDRALELLRTVQMPQPEQKLHAYPHQLSGGQRQRVVLAMALANDPALLICDEPTTALDVTVQARMIELIDRLVSDRHTSLLFITHDLAVVSNLCERVLVMYGGRIVESGPVDQIFSAPRHPYTAGLLAASDLADAVPGTRLPTIGGSVPGVGEFPSGCVFRNRCPNAIDQCTTLPLLSAVDGQRRLACFNPVRGDAAARGPQPQLEPET